MAVIASISAFVLGASDIRTLLADLRTDVDTLSTELLNKLMSSEAIIHTDGVNTDCNTLSYAKHIVFSDGSNTTTPTPAGLYFVEVDYLTTELGDNVIGQRAWRFSTGVLYSRLYRNSVWSTWNKIG